MEEKRAQRILFIIRSIENSDQSVSSYFATHSLPFSRVQYYSYLNTIKEHGQAGLRDKRSDGKNRKLTSNIASYIKEQVYADPTISTSMLQSRIEEEFRKAISKSSLNDFRKVAGLLRQRAAMDERSSREFSGGGESLTALAFS